jgi:DNA-binding transcriptional regulator YhcF (GntR family)
MAKPLPNDELTTSEKRCLAAFRKHVERYKSEPTIRWLAEQLEVYPNTITYALKKLRGKGFLEDKPITVIRIKLSERGKKVPL